MRAAIAIVSIAFAVPSFGAADTTRLPLTVEERNAACLEVEDEDSPRAIALADSVLAEAVPPPVLQVAEAHGCRGWALASLGRRDDARRDAHALHELALTLPAGADRVRLLRRAGGILHRSADRVGAVDLYAQAVADAEAQGLEAQRIPLLVNLGVLHSEFEEHERARVNYEQALALMQRLGDLRYEAPVRFNLALNLNGQERFADAVPHLRRAIELMESSGFGGPAQLLKARLALATALLETGDKEGSTRLLAAIRAADRAQLDSSTASELALVEAARLSREGRAAQALAILDAIEADSLQDFQQWTVLNRRATLLERLGRHAEANVLLRRAATMREAYLRHQNHERLAALDTHLRDREQRAELERLKGESERQEREMAASERQQMIIASVGGVLILLAIGLLVWQRRMNRRLYEASHTDPLTGLANRRAMALELRTLAREASGTALMLIDIDHFKRINDEHGHDIGDEVLVAFARRLREHAGKGALVARWGGEEFLVVLPRSDAEAAVAHADTLRAALAQPVGTHAGELVAHASIGIANLPLPGASPGGIEPWHVSLQLADHALYLAKRAGRDGWVRYWIERAIPDWPAERLGREPALARSLGLIEPTSSRPLREPLAAVGA